MRQLEEENLRLKRLAADLSPDKSMLQDVLAGKCGPGGYMQVVSALSSPGHGISVVQGHCGVLLRQDVTRMPERERVRVSGGCTVQNLDLSHTCLTRANSTLGRVTPSKFTEKSPVT